MNYEDKLGILCLCLPDISVSDSHYNFKNGHPHKAFQNPDPRFVYKTY